MPEIITEPSIIKAAGNKPKIIREYFGRVRTGNPEVSIARMISPEGWEEPFQKPEFTEYTLVIEGTLVAEVNSVQHRIGPGEAIIVYPGERVRYSTPEKGGAEYVAICLPAFSPELVHRENTAS